MGTVTYVDALQATTSKWKHLAMAMTLTKERKK
jgi:hypothetical protein